jgi:hypothetical protein
LLVLVPHVRALEWRDDEVLRLEEDLLRRSDVGVHAAILPFLTDIHVRYL